jgi:hypothetical protein
MMLGQVAWVMTGTLKNGEMVSTFLYIKEITVCRKYNFSAEIFIKFY